MGRLSANAKLALGKGYTKGGTDEPYLVLELVLPSGTRRYGVDGVSSDARGGIEPRIQSWGTLRLAIDSLTHGLAEATCQPELDDSDEVPALRRLFARELAKYPNQHRRSAATIRLVSPDIPDADTFVVFTGILDGADQVAPMRWRLRLRTDDGPLRSTAGKTGAIPRVPLARYFDAIDATVSGFYAPIIYGVHNSNGSSGKGFVPCHLVDSVNFKYVIALGWLNTVSAVYEDGALLASSLYTVGHETFKGALFTTLTFTGAHTGTITADVEGLTASSDGTGGLITDPGLIIKHLIVTFGYNDWRSGVYPGDGTAPIDATSFTTVGTFLTTMGYEGSFYLDGAQQTTLLDVFNKWLADHGAYAWWTNLGKLTIKILDHRPPTTIYPTDPVLEGDVDELGGFQAPYSTDQIEREISVQYLRGAVDQKTYQTLKVADLSVTERVSTALQLEWAKASLL